MCVIVASKTGLLPTNEHLMDMAHANADGIGLAWHDGDYLRTQWGLRMADMETAFKAASGCPYVLHFRLATHGTVSTENCHPFWLGKHAALAHNGVLSGYGSRHLSDTRDYIARRLPQLVGDYTQRNWIDPVVKAAIGKDIGSNKFAILDVYGDLTIINDRLGVSLPEYPDVWFSNDYWHRDRWFRTKTLSTSASASDVDWNAWEADLERALALDETDSYVGFCDFCNCKGTLHYCQSTYKGETEENYLCRECFREWSEYYEA